jgi:hypothetical protein
LPPPSSWACGGLTGDHGGPVHAGVVLRLSVKNPFKDPKYETEEEWRRAVWRIGVPIILVWSYFGTKLVLALLR